MDNIGKVKKEWLIKNGISKFEIQMLIEENFISKEGLNYIDFQNEKNKKKL